MWYRYSMGQLLHLRQLHVSCSTIKLAKILCVCRTYSTKHVLRDGHTLNELRRECIHKQRLRRRSSQTGANDATGMDDSHLMNKAKILWDYLRIDDDLSQSDLILVLGNSDLRTADHAAKLYHDRYAPLIAVSGKEGHNTKGKWKKSEALIFRDRLIEQRVPSEAILVEPNATNTGENVQFTQQLLQDHPQLHQPQSVILVQTPFMGRRSLATFKKQWKNADQVAVMVTSPPIPLEEYPNQGAGFNSVIDVANEMIRNLERIQKYPRLGYQISQDIPSDVLQAFHYLQSKL